jgi:poly(A) polymerase
MLAATPQLAAALQIVAALRAAGHESYLAGGCVRDLLLGREPSDYDVATSATPDIVLNLFPRTFAVGAHFGVVLVATICDESDAVEAELSPPQVAEGRPPGRPVPPPQVVTEVATFRSDGAYSDGRHPDAVRYTTSAEEDVRRRDFTINGLLIDPMKGTGFSPYINSAINSEDSQLAEKCQRSRTKRQGTTSVVPHSQQNKCRALAPEGSFSAGLRSVVIDHVHGLADLDAGIIRAIGQPEQRFEEDHLRILRAVRFAARFGFQIDPATAAAMHRLAPKTNAVSRERVRDELTKMLTEGHARRAFELLDETGLLAELLPEVARMKGVEQPPNFHPEGDVWIHILLLLAQLPPACPLPLAWGALLHDVGKPPTFMRADRIRFNGHVDVGVAIAADICRRFRFSNDETRQTLSLVENHMRFADAQHMKASTLKRFFRLENFPQHLELHRMDCLAGSGNLDHWNFVRERYESMPAESVRPAPLLTGRELIAAGYQPGAAFKEMLRAVEDAQLEGVIATPAEALTLLRDRFPLPN